MLDGYGNKINDTINVENYFSKAWVKVHIFKEPCGVCEACRVNAEMEAKGSTGWYICKHHRGK